MIKKFFSVSAGLALLALPIVVLAVETVTAVAERPFLYVLYEKTVGPIGAVAGFIAMVVLWQLAKKVNSNFRFILMVFAVVVILDNIGSISYGIHSLGLLGGETSRYIERTCRTIALLIADISALILYKKLTGDKVVSESKPEISQQ